MNYQEVIDTVTTAILENVKKAVKSQTECDHTFKAKVTEIVADDKVRVLHSGKKYTTATSIKCEIDDIVRVCAPCNNYLDLYVVENKTKGRTLRDLQKKVSDLETNYLPKSGGTLTGDLTPKALLSSVSGSSLRTGHLHILPAVGYALIEPNHQTDLYFKELLKWTCANYKDSSGGSIFIGVGVPNSAGIVLFHIYNTTQLQDGLPRYSSGMFIDLGPTFNVFGTNNYVYSFKQM